MAALGNGHVSRAVLYFSKLEKREANFDFIGDSASWNDCDGRREGGTSKRILQTASKAANGFMPQAKEVTPRWERRLLRRWS